MNSIQVGDDTGKVMTHVVTSACMNHKYQDCVAVCPVEAFREMDTYLVIDPDECIDCGACVPECPVEAIFLDDDVPEEWEEYTALNAKLAANWPLIDSAQDPMSTADEFKDVPQKRALLSEAAPG